MKSKDFAILVNRLENENKNLLDLITQMQLREIKYNEKMMRVAEDYRAYHSEMISYIKRLDKELAEENPSSSN